MKKLFGGIDIGSEFHQVVIIDGNDKVIYEKKVFHRFSEFHEAVAEIKGIEGKEKAKIEFAIEGKNGYGAPFDRILIENRFTVYNIDSLKLKQFRNAFGAEWKADRRDAKMLAKLLKMKDLLDKDEGEKVFISISIPPLVHEELKLLSRHQQTLIDEKVRIGNRLEKKILEVCPDIFDIFECVNTKKLLDILVQYPDFSGYKDITEKKLLKIDGIGKETLKRVTVQLQSVECVKKLAGTYAIIIKSYARRMLELKEEIKELDKKLDEIGKESKEAQHVKSIPGVGTKLASRLIGEIGDINRFENEAELADYCGVGCLDDESGKRKNSKANFKANRICKATMIKIAGCTIRSVDQSRAYYAKQRYKGREHNDALRRLARQLIKVIFKLLKENRDYNIESASQKKAA